MTRRPLVPAVAAAAILMTALGACTSDPGSAASSGADATVTVRSTADDCDLSAESVPRGDLVFEVTNEGSDVTEFYLYAADGRSVLGEVENIGPGLTRNLVVAAQPGDYLTACKPGMVGEGIRHPFTVTG